MLIREALIVQHPSLALQRAASDEIARLDLHIKQLEAQLRQQQFQVMNLIAKLDEQRKD